jgi:hypothetical protein
MCLVVHSFIGKKEQNKPTTTEHYTIILQDHEVEKEKLGSIFIQPKVKGKKKAKGHSNSSSPTRQPPPIPEHPGPEDPDMGAEELWAKRSASLANHKVCILSALLWSCRMTDVEVSSWLSLKLLPLVEFDHNKLLGKKLSLVTPQWYNQRSIYLYTTT